MPPGAAGLDIPCGPGRHALEFARRGYRVTAVDLMPFFLEHGLRLAKEDNLAVEFLQGDMRTFVRPESFDLIWNFFSSFGYFDDPKDDRAFLNNTFKNLAPNGRLLLEMHSRDHALIFWKDHDRFQHPSINGITLIEQGRISEDQTRVDLHWRIVKKDQTSSEYHFALRLYSKSQLKAAIKNAGFSAVAIHGDMLANPYTPDCERMVVVAKK